MPRSWSAPGLLVLLLGCGPGASGSSMGSDDANSGPAPSADGTAGPSDGSLGNGHGVVLLELLRAQSGGDDPFVGTHRVEATLLYMECLFSFYEDNPQWEQLGPQGSVVFDESVGETGTLCDPSLPSAVDCQAVELSQQFQVLPQLSVAYEVEGPLENRQLRFGPLPTAGLANCEGGGQPIVRMRDSAVRGIDAGGSTIWQTDSFNPLEAATDQGASIMVRVIGS